MATDAAHADGARAWDRRYAGPGLVWSPEPNRLLVAQVGALPPGRALDLGAGEGRNAVWLAEQGWRVTAVDFSQVGLDTAERMAGERGMRLDLVRADLADYVPEPAAHDLVILLYLQVPEPLLRTVLARAAESLAPGGTMLVIGHDLANLDGGYGGPQNPALLMTAEVVSDALRDLEVERAERVDRPVATESGPRVALDTLVRAHRSPSR